MTRGLAFVALGLLAWIGLEVHWMRTHESLESWAQDAARHALSGAKKDDTATVAAPFELPPSLAPAASQP